jgi:hypothetical protein
MKMHIIDMIDTLEREIVPIIRSWQEYDSAGDFECALNKKITGLGFGHTIEFHTIWLFFGINLSGRIVEVSKESGVHENFATLVARLSSYLDDKIPD